LRGVGGRDIWANAAGRRLAGGEKEKSGCA